MSEVLYPKPRPPKPPSTKPWAVDYELAYDGGGGEWTGYYRWRWSAKAAAWLNHNILSYGGGAALRRNEAAS